MEFVPQSIAATLGMPPIYCYEGLHGAVEVGSVAAACVDELVGTDESALLPEAGA